jgi:hypothetical protein
MEVKCHNCIVDQSIQLKENFPAMRNSKVTGKETKADNEAQRLPAAKCPRPKTKHQSIRDKALSSIK